MTRDVTKTKLFGVLAMFLFSLAIVKNCELSLEKSVRGEEQADSIIYSSVDNER